MNLISEQLDVLDKIVISKRINPYAYLQRSGMGNKKEIGQLGEGDHKVVLVNPEVPTQVVAIEVNPKSPEQYKQQHLLNMILFNLFPRQIPKPYVIQQIKLPTAGTVYGEVRERVFPSGLFKIWYDKRISQSKKDPYPTTDQMKYEMRCLSLGNYISDWEANIMKGWTNLDSRTSEYFVDTPQQLPLTLQTSLFELFIRKHTYAAPFAKNVLQMVGEYNSLSDIV